MSKPRIVLMDEPSVGLSPIFVEEIFNIIKEISAEGTTAVSYTHLDVYKRQVMDCEKMRKIARISLNFREKVY